MFLEKEEGIHFRNSCSYKHIFNACSLLRNGNGEILNKKNVTAIEGDRHPSGRSNFKETEETGNELFEFEKLKDIAVKLFSHRKINALEFLWVRFIPFFSGF